MGEVIEVVPPKLDRRRSDFLDWPFSAAEVKKAIFDMFPTKAFRVDEIPALFYQKFWYTVGSAVTVACFRYLNHGDSLEDVNRTLITLIPKVPIANRVADFQPINLCNVSYKIVVKTLVDRVRLVLGDVIFEA